MKYFFIFLVLSLFVVEPKVEAFLLGLDKEVKVSGFSPCSSELRETYSSVIPCYELQLSKTLCHVQGFVGIAYIADRYEEGETSSHFYFIPTTVGFKLNVSLNSFLDIYFGAGGCKSFLWAVERTPYFKQHVYKDGFGGVGQVGFLLHGGPWLILDVFAEYLHQDFSFGHENAFHKYTNFRGYKVGAGIGLRF